MKLREIAERLGCALHEGGDPELDIAGVAGMEQATPSHLTFLANPKYAHKVKDSRAGAILASKPVDAPIATVISAQPYVDFARALELFYQPPKPPARIHPLASVAASATVGEGASIGAFAIVGERVTIGRGAVIHPHVVIYEGVSIGDDFLAHSGAVVREFCRIGHRVILQNNVVVGGDGYGFAKRADGTHYKIVQSGAAVIEVFPRAPADGEREADGLVQSVRAYSRTILFPEQHVVTTTIPATAVTPKMTITPTKVGTAGYGLSAFGTF